MSHKMKLLSQVGLVALCTVGSAGCVYRTTGSGYGYYGGSVHATTSVAVGDPGVVYVSSLPPQPIYEEIPPAPYYSWVWVDGYWDWRGHEWSWVSGRWCDPLDN